MVSHNPIWRTVWIAGWSWLAVAWGFGIHIKELSITQIHNVMEVCCPSAIYTWATPRLIGGRCFSCFRSFTNGLQAFQRSHHVSSSSPSPLRKWRDLRPLAMSWLCIRDFLVSVLPWPPSFNAGSISRAITSVQITNLTAFQSRHSGMHTEHLPLYLACAWWHCRSGCSRISLTSGSGQLLASWQHLPPREYFDPMGLAYEANRRSELILSRIRLKGLVETAHNLTDIPCEYPYHVFETRTNPTIRFSYNRTPHLATRSRFRYRRSLHPHYIEAVRRIHESIILLCYGSRTSNKVGRVLEINISDPQEHYSSR